MRWVGKGLGTVGGVPGSELAAEEFLRGFTKKSIDPSRNAVAYKRKPTKPEKLVE